MAAEQLLSTMKGVTPVTGTPQKPLPRDAFIDPRTGAERPINNPLTNPNYQKDLENSLKNAEINKQFVAVAESKTLSPEQKQVQMDTLRAQKTAMGGITPEMRTQYTAEMNLPQNLYTPPVVRDMEKEQSTIDRLGGAPTNEREFQQTLLATYGKSGLEQMGATVGAGGVIQAFDPAKLKAAGFSDAQIASLSQAGQAANVAQKELAATPQPTNAMLGVLQSALKAASGVGKQEIGTSKVLEAAGIPTTGALGYGALAQSMQQRRAEMGQLYDSYANTLQAVGGQMADTYANTLAAYNSTMARYDKQVAALEQVNEETRQYEKQLELLKKKAEIDRETDRLRISLEEQSKPTVKFIEGTENQPAGYFDSKSGKFTPLSVGGNAYGAAASSYSYAGTPAPNGSSQYYATPVPHGSVNTTVVASNPKLIDLYKNGFQKALGANSLAGQCAYEAEQWVDFNGKGWTVGNTLQDKAKSLDNFVKQGQAFYKGQAFGQVGNAIISNDDPKYGHVSVINAITDDGKYVVSEFNRAGSRVYTNNRILDPNDKSILGILKTVPKSEYQIKEESSVAAAATKAAGAIKDIFTGKKQGGLLDLLSAATTLGTKALVSAGKGAVDAKAKAEMEAKIQDGIKAGILDENGMPYSPDRMSVRSGLLPDAMLNSKFTSLQTAVKKGLESPDVLNLFQQDVMAGQAKKREVESQQKLSDKLAQPMSPEQSKSIGFAVSARQAEGFLPSSGTDPKLSALNSWFSRSGRNDDIVSDQINQVKDPVARQVVQAEMQWVANVLRGESGAAISLGEYKDAGRTYFPRPGDTAEMLKTKKAARETKVNNLLLNGGPQGAQYWLNMNYELPPAIAKQYGLTAKNASEQQAPNVPTSGTVLARWTDGKVYSIDAADIAAAKKEGWTILN